MHRTFYAPCFDLPPAATQPLTSIEEFIIQHDKLNHSLLWPAHGAQLPTIEKHENYLSPSVME